VQHPARSGDVGDALVTEVREVVHRVLDAGRVIHRDRGERRRPALGMPERHRGHAELRAQRDARVVVPEVGEEHPVDPAVADERAVGGEFGGLGVHHAQHERLAGGGEFHLDPRDEGGEERVAAHDVGIAVDHESERERAGDTQ
jgi:hypothetical protein